MSWISNGYKQSKLVTGEDNKPRYRLLINLARYLIKSSDF